MKKILLISDTHSFLDENLIKHILESDEVWHAGDVGAESVLDEIIKLKPLHAVYGNIDNQSIRQRLKPDLIFTCEQVKICITHDCGHPNQYNLHTQQLLKTEKPKIFICGHSHILKVFYNNPYEVLHLNPGACGNYGIHKIKTALRFEIERETIKNLAIIEFGKN